MATSDKTVTASHGADHGRAGKNPSTDAALAKGKGAAAETASAKDKRDAAEGEGRVSKTGEKGGKGAHPPGAKSNLRKRVLIGSLVVVLLAVIGAGGWSLLADEEDPAPAAKRASTAASKTASSKQDAAKKISVYAPLEVFTVNLQPGEHDAAGQILQTGLTLRVRDQDAAELVKVHNPDLRNRVLILLSSKRAAEISTPEGKQKLAESVLAEVNKGLPSGAPEPAAQAVLFTSFIIQ